MAAIAAISEPSGRLLLGSGGWQISSSWLRLLATWAWLYYGPIPSDTLALRCAVVILGSSSWTAERRKWKVDYADVSMVSELTVAMVCLFSCVDGEEQAAEDPSVGGPTAKATIESCYAGLAWR
jgi:hypothetical protein